MRSRTIATLAVLLALGLSAGTAISLSAGGQDQLTLRPETAAARHASHQNPRPLRGEGGGAAQAATPGEGSPTPGTQARKVVILDPGHGGDEVGAANHGVVEKASNLDMALRVESLLHAQGFDVFLTRRTDSRAADQIAGYTATRTDLQARLDIANAAQGDVFVSLHSNGSSDTSLSGVEAWYDSSRPFAVEGQQLARLLKDSVLSELDRWGYRAADRGLFDGKCFRNRGGRCFTLFVIAGPRETTREEVTRRGGDPEDLGFNGAEVIYSRAANMPAALLETLFISNPSDAAVLRNESARDAIARGIANAIVQFLTQPA
ncbi:MAG TPA: N-acetylmuramoyl-L-alanine amidase [Dehalococcoidia bacterium]|nr:N-acetylmuramoyl-L-alanine amidase [Dehalococcoidia bacterium]